MAATIMVATIMVATGTSASDAAGTCTGMVTVVVLALVVVVVALIVVVVGLIVLGAVGRIGTTAVAGIVRIVGGLRVVRRVGTIVVGIGAVRDSVAVGI